MSNNESQLFKPVTDEIVAGINGGCDVIHHWAKLKGWWNAPAWRDTLAEFNESGDASIEVKDAIRAALAQPVRNKGELLALVTSEVSECLEALRTKTEDGSPAMDDKVPALTGEAAEIADIVIRLMDYCGAFGIDLGNAIRQKHEFNITRPMKHGKQF
jgi:NTP pyrophosphatase (non-canonical NTP hydrolase)